jgi:hypothetical protein
MEIFSFIKRSTPEATGHMADSLRYVVGGRMTRKPPENGTFTVGGVTNIASYASVHEIRGWAKPFFNPK